jgi:hypothetical protein
MKTNNNPEILDRGYVTHALTDGETKIYGMVVDCYINNWHAAESDPKVYYWSEVYVEPRHMAKIIRRGEVLVDATDKHLSELHELSKINLCGKSQPSTLSMSTVAKDYYNNCIPRRTYGMEKVIATDGINTMLVNSDYEPRDGEVVYKVKRVYNRNDDGALWCQLYKPRNINNNEKEG